MTTTLTEIFRHNRWANHATEHRAHAATVLTQLGIEPPPVDGWNFGEFGG